jgi:hypothetical protein
VTRKINLFRRPLTKLKSKRAALHLKKAGSGDAPGFDVTVAYLAGTGSRGKRGRPRGLPDRGPFDALFDALTINAATLNGSVTKSLL